MVRGHGSIFFVFICCPHAGFAQTWSSSTTTDTSSAPFDTLVTDKRPKAAETAFATRLSAESYVSTASTVYDLVQQAPSSQIRRSGSFGGYTDLALRGFGGNNVAVVLDEQPLSQATLGAVDLSLIPLEQLQAVEIFRSFAPIRFVTPLGGVVRLVSKQPGTTWQSLGHAGYGSFTNREAHVSVSGPWRQLRLAAYATYQGSAGNFTYYDDRETLYNAEDDLLRSRQNNGFNNLTAALTSSHTGAGQSLWRERLQITTRKQGVPGPGQLKTTESHAEYHEGNARIDAMNFSLGPARLSFGADTVWSRRMFLDPQQELGLRVRRATSRLWQIALDGRLSATLIPNMDTEVSLRGQNDTFVQDSNIGGAAGQDLALERERLQFGVGIEHIARFGNILKIVPGVRVDWAHDRDHDSRQNFVAMQAGPRLGASVELSSCRMMANTGRFQRFPTLLERYGDNVVTVSNVDLLPEHGFTADIGGECAWGNVLGLKTFQIQSAYFHTRGNNLITLLPNSQATLRAENLGDVHLSGFEQRILSRWLWFRLQINYTITHSQDQSGLLGQNDKALPGIPEHRFDGSFDMGSTDCFVRYDISWASLFFLDQANLRPAPSRTLHHVQGNFPIPHTALVLRASIRNLTNRLHDNVPLMGGVMSYGRSKVADFLGYPLPGRSYFVSLIWRSL